MPVGATLRRLSASEGIARDSALTLAANLAGGVLTIVFLAIWSRALTLGEFGALSLVLAVSNLVRPLLDLGIHNALIQGMSFNRAQANQRAAAEVGQVASVARLVATCVALFVSWPVAVLIGHHIYGDPGASVQLTWGIATGAALAARQHFESMLRADRRFVLIAYANVARFILPVVISTPALWTKNPSLTWAFAANVASPLIFIVMAVPAVDWAAIALVRPSYRHVGQTLFTFAVWIAVVRALDIAIQLDVPIIRYFLNTVQVAYYYSAYRVLDLFTTLGAAIGFVLLPHFSAMAIDLEKLKALPASVLTRLAALAVPLCIALFFLTPVVVPLVWGQQYRPAIAVVWFLLPGAVFALLAVGSGEILMAKQKPLLIVPQAVVNFVANVVLLVILVPRFGILGAAVATSASYGLVLLVAWGIVFRELKVEVDVGGPVRAMTAGFFMAVTTWLVINLSPTSTALVVVGTLCGLIMYVAMALAIFPAARASSVRMWADVRGRSA